MMIANKQISYQPKQENRNIRRMIPDDTGILVDSGFLIDRLCLMRLFVRIGYTQLGSEQICIFNPWDRVSDHVYVLVP